SVEKLSKSQCSYRLGIRARSITFSARSSIPHSQATAMLPAPSLRATSFHPVPLHSKQSSRAIVFLWSAGALLPLLQRKPAATAKAAARLPHSIVRPLTSTNNVRRCGNLCTKPSKRCTMNVIPRAVLPEEPAFFSERAKRKGFTLHHPPRAQPFLTSPFAVQ